MPSVLEKSGHRQEGLLGFRSMPIYRPQLSVVGLSATNPYTKHNGLCSVVSGQLSTAAVLRSEYLVPMSM